MPGYDRAWYTYFNQTAILGISLTGNLSEVDAVIADTPFANGTTNIWSGLYEAYIDMSNAHSDKKYVVLISDGEPNQPWSVSNATALTYLRAAALKNSGITIFTIWLDVKPGGTAEQILQQVASTSGHYFAAPTTDVLSGILQMIQSDSCICGNGSIDPGEQCDDGNIDNDDTCTILCQAPVCGDGFSGNTAWEQCDDGNTVDNDGCSNSCVLRYCGDDIVQVNQWEQCDGLTWANGVLPDWYVCTQSCVVQSTGWGICEEVTPSNIVLNRVSQPGTWIVYSVNLTGMLSGAMVDTITWNMIDSGAPFFSLVMICLTCIFPMQLVSTL